MGSFRDMPAEDGLSYGLSLLYRSGWAGTDPALIQLRTLLEGLLAFDLTGAVYAYHQMTAALLQKGDRRVSGDLFKDHLLGLAVHQAHAFARMAAKGQRDEALWMLMQEELSILGGLSQLTSQDVARYTRERQQALAMRPRQGKDALSVWPRRPGGRQHPAPAPGGWGRSHSPARALPKGALRLHPLAIRGAGPYGRLCGGRGPGGNLPAAALRKGLGPAHRGPV